VTHKVDMAGYADHCAWYFMGFIYLALEWLCLGIANDITYV